MQPLEGSVPRATAAATLPDHIAFLGLGLIGGSIVLALRESGYGGSIAAWTPQGRGPAAAMDRGIIDEVAPNASTAIERAGLVILAGPPLAVLAVLDDLAGPFRGAIGAGVTITDVASTKERIVDRAARLGLPFVGGHPMAGRETTGIESATADLFQDRPWVLVGDADPPPPSLAIVERLARAAGAIPVRMSAAAHDAAIAAISHAPLVLSAALVEAIALTGDEGVDWPAARELAAGGWRDMSRLAKGDPEMGAGILATNGFATAHHLRLVREALDRWIERLEAQPPQGDPEPSRAALVAAREALVRDESR